MAHAAPSVAAMGKRSGSKNWGAIVREFERSGETHEAFCEKHGHRVGTFRARLYEARRRRGVEDVRLVPVEVVTSATQAPRELYVEIEVGVGVVLRAPVGADARYVAALVVELRGAC